MKTLTKSISHLFIKLPLLFILVIISGLPLHAESGIPAKPLMLRGGTMIDGTGAPAITNATIIIENGKIRFAGSTLKAPTLPHATIIDATGMFILPGIINAHVHMAFDRNRLSTWLKSGVTTVRDESVEGYNLNPAQHAALIKESQTSNTLCNLISAGTMISVPGGYGGTFVETPEQARNLVQKEIKSGYHMIKISMEDGYAGQSGLPKLDAKLVTAILNEAKRLGVRVSCHITQREWMDWVIKIGTDDAHVSDIAHVPFDYSSNADTWNIMVRQGIILIPTFTVFRNFGAPVGSCVLNVTDFMQAGGKIALGNDFGGGPGEFEEGIPIYEMEMLKKAGMNAIDVIKSSTLNAAEACGLIKTHGSLEIGKNADLIVVKGNPLDDFATFKKPEMVIKNGIIISLNP